MASNKRVSRAKPSEILKDPSPPFKRPPRVLIPFIDSLSPEHIYITHIDSQPAILKRKLFLVPVALNVCISLLFLWRMYSILPWYWQLLVAAFGYPSAAGFPASDSTWAALALEITKRGIVMFIDFMLFVFVWPWPVEFAAGRYHGSPMLWRFKVGFRNKEVYVRRSRSWDRGLGDFVADSTARNTLASIVGQATSPLLQEQKTGYLLINGQWNLDWDAMIYAHALVDANKMALDAFKNVVLLHDGNYGWLCYDLGAGIEDDDDERKRQVFAFRDTLTAIGKEDVFYRWVEMVQFEVSQPGGFGADRQEVAGKKIRQMFEAENIDFEELWKEATTG
ncbi:hypothetical protein CDD81_6198 [Ophiocordyceps australis]|uniref:Uncharacterized protein n=1 Tax=Ophiocordyceps australis TaxID=1399860 RepID=A0A2C5XDC2_9HYPO|nr:hypothetical protein CDD81_6198 [Ophiocordyceps australis]